MFRIGNLGVGGWEDGNVLRKCLTEGPLSSTRRVWPAPSSSAIVCDVVECSQRPAACPGLRTLRVPAHVLFSHVRRPVAAPPHGLQRGRRCRRRGALWRSDGGRLTVRPLRRAGVRRAGQAEGGPGVPSGGQHALLVAVVRQVPGRLQDRLVEQEGAQDHRGEHAQQQDAGVFREGEHQGLVATRACGTRSSAWARMSTPAR